MLLHLYLHWARSWATESLSRIPHQIIPGILRCVIFSTVMSVITCHLFSTEFLNFSFWALEYLARYDCLPAWSIVRGFELLLLYWLLCRLSHRSGPSEPRSGCEPDHLWAGRIVAPGRVRLLPHRPKDWKHIPWRASCRPREYSAPVWVKKDFWIQIFLFWTGCCWLNLCWPSGGRELLPVCESVVRRQANFELGDSRRSWASGRFCKRRLFRRARFPSDPRASGTSRSSDQCTE